MAEAETAAEAALFGDDIAGLRAAAAPSPATAPMEDAPEDEGREDAATPTAGLPKPRGLDESLMAVLREEAEREVQARRSEQPRGLETQTEMGLDTASAASALSPTQRRLAMLKGQNPDASPPLPPKPAARRDLLPDVEEINSTLRSSRETRDADDQIEALPDLVRSRGGFRSGFVLMLLLACAVVVVYVTAPRLAEQFPAAAGGLNGFVAQVDLLRGWLNGLMESATAALNGQGA